MKQILILLVFAGATIVATSCKKETDNGKYCWTCIDATSEIELCDRTAAEMQAYENNGFDCEKQ